MNIYFRTVNSRNIQLNLFDWSTERELRRSNRIARRIAARFGVSLIHAATITRP